MSEGGPKTSRPPSEWLLGLTGAGYATELKLQISTQRRSLKLLRLSFTK